MISNGDLYDFANTQQKSFCSWSRQTNVQFSVGRNRKNARPITMLCRNDPTHPFKLSLGYWQLTAREMIKYRDPVYLCIYLPIHEWWFHMAKCRYDTTFTLSSGPGIIPSIHREDTSVVERDNLSAGDPYKMGKPWGFFQLFSFDLKNKKMAFLALKWQLGFDPDILPTNSSFSISPAFLAASLTQFLCIKRNIHRLLALHCRLWKSCTNVGIFFLTPLWTNRLQNNSSTVKNTPEWSKSRNWNNKLLY